MDNELDTFGIRQANFKQLPREICADEHRELVEFEDPDRVSVRVEHVVIADPVLPSAGQDDGVHDHQYILTMLGRSSL